MYGDATEARVSKSWLREVDMRQTVWLTVFLMIAVGSCGGEPGANLETEVESSGVSEEEFRELLDILASSWESQDAATAVQLFTQDALYMEPPDVQLFEGHDQLASYFGALEPGTRMRWHNVWFDPRSQVGVGEFTFGRSGAEESTHGVAVVTLRDGRIASWHEYLQRGPSDRETFLAPEGKQWTWHIGNYP